LHYLTGEGKCGDSLSSHLYDPAANVVVPSIVFDLERVQLAVPPKHSAESASDKVFVLCDALANDFIANV